MTELRIELLGGLTLTQNGAPVTTFMSSKVPALLAYLAVTRRAHSRDALATLLWGELPDADAKNNLRQTLSNLKRFFEPHLTITRETMAFNTNTPYFLDVHAFETFIGDQRQPADDEPTLRRLLSAVALYRGDFLHGFFVRDAPEFEEWMLAQRAHLRDLALNALLPLTESHMRRGEYRAGIQYAARLLEMDAWREEAHRLLMSCYARTGQRSAALAQYKRCGEILQQEFGVEPSEETHALYERIRAAGETPRTNLPPEATSFVGRVNELAQIESHLLKPDCRLVTVLGSGGVGKTRLAIQAAKHLWEQGAFLNGVIFVSLVGVDAFDRIAPAMANAFGVSLVGSLEPKTQIADYLREKELLVVLDNAEHQLDAAAWFVELLHLAPRLKFLVTTREKFNTRWEWVVPLEGLDVGAADSARDAVRPSAAARLFVERARQAAPAFEWNETTMPGVIRVCELVEGLPLGIELAAAWTARYACEEIVQEIERSFDFLATTLRDQPQRQQSLRAVFEYSWLRLAVPEQDAFARLAVFSNGFTRDAANHLAPAAPHALDALINKALVLIPLHF